MPVYRFPGSQCLIEVQTEDSARRLNLRLTLALKNRVRRVAEAEGLTMTDFVVRAIERELARNASDNGAG